MKIKVKYFAALREIAGKSEEVINTKSHLVSDLFYELSNKYKFTMDIDLLKVAVNEEYSTFDYELTDLDTIVFIPPVAGG